MERVRKGERRTDPDGPRPLADAVLRLIWREKRISRAAIAQQGELSRSTVSEVVSEILPTGLVAEVGDPVWVASNFHDPAKLTDGFNDVGGEEIFYISNPALGLWAYQERFQ